MKAAHSLWLVGLLAASLLLSGCGGGGGGGTTSSAPTQLPNQGGPASTPLSGGGSYKEVTFSGGQGSDSVTGFGTTTKYVLLTRYNTDTGTSTGYSLAKSFSSGMMKVLPEPWSRWSSPQEPLRREEYTPERDRCTQIREWEHAYLTRAGRPILPSRSHALPESVGDQHTFWVNNTQGVDEQRTCTNQKVGTYCYIYVDDADWAGNGGTVTQAVADAAAAEFDRVYPLVRNAFGTEWTTNGGRDGQTGIYILLSSKVPVYGYFWGRDEYPTSTFAQSNEREILYIAPSPWVTGITGGNAAQFLEAKATLAHEFQHMINFNEKFCKQGQFNGVQEDTWVNEGLSMLAETIGGVNYGLPNGSQYHYNMVKNYENAPNSYSLTSWTSSNYGLSYLFCQYLYDWYGGNAIKTMETNGSYGAANVAAVTGKTFDQVFQEWCMAMFLDTAGVTTDYMYFKSIDTSGTFGGKYYGGGSLPGPLIDSVDCMMALSSNQSSRSMKGYTLEFVRAFLNAGSGNLTMTLTDSNNKNLKATQILGY
ncbi:MAG: hypothetical protein HYU64_14070 [Armatimonadetes bacterium]|nr:hypothetical protein [Armatimonadota bacterium]